MTKTVFNKQKKIPWFLIPKLRKHHAQHIYSKNETKAWRLFSEGCLRNGFFHDAVLNRGKHCLACKRAFNHQEAQTRSKIDKHHHCYLRQCIGTALEDDHADIYRKATNKEPAPVPNCRQCARDHPDYHAGCVAKVFPVHHACHRDIHELEQALFTRLHKKLLTTFKDNTVIR